MKKWILFLLTFALLLVLPACKQPTPEEPAGYLITIKQSPRAEYELTQAHVETLEAILKDATWTNGELKLKYTYQFTWGDRVIQYFAQGAQGGIVRDLLGERYCELSEEQGNVFNEVIEAFGLNPFFPFPN